MPSRRTKPYDIFLTAFLIKSWQWVNRSQIIYTPGVYQTGLCAQYNNMNSYTCILYTLRYTQANGRVHTILRFERSALHPPPTVFSNSDYRTQTARVCLLCHTSYTVIFIITIANIDTRAWPLGAIYRKTNI